MPRGNPWGVKRRERPGDRSCSGLGRGVGRSRVKAQERRARTDRLELGHARAADSVCRRGGSRRGAPAGTAAARRGRRVSHMQGGSPRRRGHHNSRGSVLEGETRLNVGGRVVRRSRVRQSPDACDEKRQGQPASPLHGLAHRVLPAFSRLRRGGSDEPLQRTCRKSSVWRVRQEDPPARPRRPPYRESTGASLRGG